MQLALRKDAARDATPFQCFACDVIKARLVSEFCHGGIVINGDLYHATATRGLHKVPKGEWTPDLWVLRDVPQADEARALRNFARHKGAKYDWFSLLAFVGVRAKDDARLYCFEWCYYAMTGLTPQGRVTPENLLLIAQGVKV